MQQKQQQRMGLAVAIAVAAATAAAATELEVERTGWPLKNVERFALHSERVGVDYRIYVALPPQYSEPDSTFPVIYNLDSDITFGMMTDISRMLRLDSLIPATIVVGIAYDKPEAEWRVNRSRDLTPTADVDEAAEFTGGGPQFLGFIEEELIPAIDGHYRTDPGDRTLSGASLAGGFVVYVLFQKPGLFQRHLAAVPSLWYDDGVLFRMEEAFAAGRKDLAARLYMSGEGFQESEWAPANWSSLWDMTARLRRHGWPSFHVYTHVTPGEHHASAQPRSFTRGLLYLFGKEPAAP